MIGQYLITSGNYSKSS